jgi:hypothetical protein
VAIEIARAIHISSENYLMRNPKEKSYPLLEIAPLFFSFSGLTTS